MSENNFEKFLVEEPEKNESFEDQETESKFAGKVNCDEGIARLSDVIDNYSAMEIGEPVELVNKFGVCLDWQNKLYGHSEARINLAEALEQENVIDVIKIFNEVIAPQYDQINTSILSQNGELTKVGEEIVKYSEYDNSTVRNDLLLSEGGVFAYDRIGYAYYMMNDLWVAEGNGTISQDDNLVEMCEVYDKEKYKDFIRDTKDKFGSWDMWDYDNTYGFSLPSLRGVYGGQWEILDKYVNHLETKKDGVIDDKGISEKQFMENLKDHINNFGEIKNEDDLWNKLVKYRENK